MSRSANVVAVNVYLATQGRKPIKFLKKVRCPNNVTSEVYKKVKSECADKFKNRSLYVYTHKYMHKYEYSSSKPTVDNGTRMVICNINHIKAITSLVPGEPTR
ncbi:hypothetical protein EV174_004463 [Coemansia sp. RSA 2320]|nr:hypothetical protein EV174_004463 [Coemansia sp. RSA 2320]